MSRAARTAGRVAAVLALATGSAVAALPAYADSATPSPIATNWYWSLTSPDVGGQSLPAGAPAAASGVPDGDLGVGYLADKLGTSDKAAAVAFDMSSIPSGSTFDSFVVTVPYDPAAHQVASGTPDLSACELLTTFPDAPGPTDMSKLPPISLPSCVKGTFNAKAGTAGGYVFELTAVANDWSGGAPANGILVRPTPGLAQAQQPFSLAFLGKKGITTTASYTPPSSGAVQPPAPGPVLPPPPLQAVQPPVAPAVTVPGPSVVPMPAPQVNPAPAAPAVQAAAYVPGSLAPGTNWWLAVLALLAVLGLTSVVLGDPLAPAAVDPRRRRFAEAVRARTHVAPTSSGRHVQSAPHFRPA